MTTETTAPAFPTELRSALDGILRRAVELAAELTRAPLPPLPGGADRLRASVIRPLRIALDQDTDEIQEPADQPESVAQRLVELAKAATSLRARPGAPAELIEATAALQEVACRLAETDGDLQALLAELAALQTTVPVGIQVMADGPYLVTNAKTVHNHLGEPIPTRPTLALCRCGASAMKPWCDGTHARVGFSGAKDPKRVPDRRDSYEGASVTVLDNRGLCQHSGFCTDRLKNAFHAGSEPFVSPSGARMDELINAARNCPSGALSYAVNGREMREQVDDYGRPENIEVTKNGPYRITGGLALTDDTGEPVARPEGASLEHYALCRCGQSQNKPFCSGMHWYVNFADPQEPEEPTVFQWAGGFPALLRVTKLFYQKYVPADPLLAPLFASMSPDHPERVAAWLSEVFGGKDGVPFYSSTYGGYSWMISQHIGKHLTEEQRARWAQLMVAAANEAMLPDDADFRASFVSYIEWGTRLAVENSQTESRPPANMPMPHWTWACDATPWSRVHALAPVETDEPVVLPADDEPIGFEKNIKTLFRQRDRMSMKFVFDLWSYDDVCTHAHSILERLRQGSMPCDGAWPDAQVQVFARWIDANMPE